MATLRPSTGRPVSSLLRSAGSLAASEANYQDQIMKTQFDANPTTENMNAYIAYLKDRAQNLSASGTIPNLSKALTLTNEINTAVTKSTTFNIDLITTQMMEGGATDQNKLDYLANNVLANPIVQQNPDMYAKYMNQAYSLQQSIAYQQQVSAVAAQTQQSNDIAAQERGYSTGEALLNAKWDQFQSAIKNGDNAQIEKAFKDSADALRSQGVKIPKGQTGDYSTVHLGFLMGQIAFNENKAQAVAAESPDDAAKYMSKARTIAQGPDFVTALANSYADPNLFHPAFDSKNQGYNAENAITGYNRISVKVGDQSITINVPQTSGSEQTPWQNLSKSKTAITQKLTDLGFKNIKTTNGQLQATISDKAYKWMGNNPELHGAQVNLIPTPRGFQIALGTTGSLYGLSFDNRGLPGLYKADAGGAWNLVGGQYGFNAKSTTGLLNASGMAAPSVAQHTANAFDTVVQHAVNLFHAPAPSYNMVQRPGGGYNFTNNGVAISAARYAQLSNTPFRTLLQNMANTGDTGAKTALNFVGNDFGYNPNAIGGNSGLYNALVWGAHSQIPSAAPTGGLQLKM